MARSTISRSLHDVGLAGWFGGTLANAVSLNAASAHAGDASASGRVANVGWDRWTPVNAALIGAHLVGSIGQLSSDSKRIHAQQGAASLVAVKTVLTAAALGATAYSRVLGRTVSKQTDVPTDSATSPSFQTPPDVAKAQQQLKALQWVIPVLTGALVVVSSFAGEQQRYTEVKSGVFSRLGDVLS